MYSVVLMLTLSGADFQPSGILNRGAGCGGGESQRTGLFQRIRERRHNRSGGCGGNSASAYGVGYGYGCSGASGLTPSSPYGYPVAFPAYAVSPYRGAYPVPQATRMPVPYAMPPLKTGK